MNHDNWIEIKAIDDSSHRYPTIGDYYKKDKDVLQIHISNLKRENKDFEFLILIHELVEWYLTENKGITEHEITKFDVKFEKDRNKGLHSEDAEPGDAINSPYRKQHRFAENIERLIAAELDIDFNEYNNFLLDFINKPKGKNSFPDKINDEIGK